MACLVRSIAATCRVLPLTVSMLTMCLTSRAPSSAESKACSCCRAMLLAGDFFLGAVGVSHDEAGANNSRAHSSAGSALNLQFYAQGGAAIGSILPGSCRDVRQQQNAFCQCAQAGETLVCGNSDFTVLCRAMLLAGDFFLGAVVAAAMTKLVLRLRAQSPPAGDLNTRTAQVRALGCACSEPSKRC